MKIDIDTFIKEHQEEIQTLINLSLNKAGSTLQNRISSGEISPNIQEILPLLLYEILTTNTVAILRLVSEMIHEAQNNIDS